MSISENGHRIGKSPILGQEDNSVMQSIVRHPEFIKNSDVAIEGVNEAVAIHCQTLVRCGVSEKDISIWIDKTKKEVTTRKKALKFIRTISDLSAPQNNAVENTSSEDNSRT